MTVLLLGSSFSYAQGESKRQVILIVINQLSFADNQIYGNVSGFIELEKQGLKGAMNINSGGSRTDANSYLSIAGGSRGNGIKEMGSSYLANEVVNLSQNITAGEIYKQQTGKELLGEDTVIYLPIERLSQTNNQKFPFKIGALGITL